MMGTLLHAYFPFQEAERQQERAVCRMFRVPLHPEGPGVQILHTSAPDTLCPDA